MKTSVRVWVALLVVLLAVLVALVTAYRWEQSMPGHSDAERIAAVQVTMGFKVPPSSRLVQASILRGKDDQFLARIVMSSSDAKNWTGPGKGFQTETYDSGELLLYSARYPWMYVPAESVTTAWANPDGTLVVLGSTADGEMQIVVRVQSVRRRLPSVAYEMFRKDYEATTRLR